MSDTHEAPPARKVLVAPDATGKQIVHGTDCGHAAALRAKDRGTARYYTVSTVEELAPLHMPGYPLPVEDLVAREFEVRPCSGLPGGEL